MRWLVYRKGEFMYSAEIIETDCSDPAEVALDAASDSNHTKEGDDVYVVDLKYAHHYKIDVDRTITAKKVL